MAHDKLASNCCSLQHTHTHTETERERERERERECRGQKEREVFCHLGTTRWRRDGSSHCTNTPVAPVGNVFSSRLSVSSYVLPDAATIARPGLLCLSAFPFPSSFPASRVATGARGVTVTPRVTGTAGGVATLPGDMTGRGARGVMVTGSVTGAVTVTGGVTGAAPCVRGAPGTGRVDGTVREEAVLVQFLGARERMPQRVVS